MMAFRRINVSTTLLMRITNWASCVNHVCSVNACWNWIHWISKLRIFTSSSTRLYNKVLKGGRDYGLEGLLGLGITTAIVGAAAVILYKSFGKKWCLFVLKWGWWRSLAALRGPQWEKDGIWSIPHIDSISLNISFLYIKIIRSVWNSIF